MSRIDHTCTFGHLVQFVDEDRALPSQVVDDITVMHDLFADVDRSAKRFQRNLHDVDGSHNTCAKAAGLEKENSFGFRLADAFGNNSVVKSGCGHVYKYTASSRPTGPK